MGANSQLCQISLRKLPSRKPRFKATLGRCDDLELLPSNCFQDAGEPVECRVADRCVGWTLLPYLEARASVARGCPCLYCGDG
jgi:hypothetical protein